MLLGFVLYVLFVDDFSGGGGNFVLSTSCIGYYDVHGGMAPMVTNGYGFFYSIRDDWYVN